jgi:hypothetical protein
VYDGEYLGDAVKAIRQLEGAQAAIKWAKQKADQLVVVGNKVKEELEDLWD